MTPSMSMDLDYELEKRADRRAVISTYAMLLTLALANIVVNSLTVTDDMSRVGNSIPALGPWIWEISSAVTIIALSPLIYLMQRRFPLHPEAWTTWLPAHAVATLIFSVLHIVIMVALRKLAYMAFIGEDYVFSRSPLSTFIYELRKDTITYALIVFMFHISRTFEARSMELAVAREEARKNHRLTLKCGGRLIWLDIADVLWVRAASNYVEVQTAQKAYLARATLKGIEGQLTTTGAPVRRIHRSYLVNLEHVTELTPTGDGDARLVLSNGETVPASRNFRDNWPSAEGHRK